MPVQHTVMLIRKLFLCPYTIQASATKPETFFWVEPDFGSKIRVESSQVGPQGRKMGPIGSGWPKIGFKFGFNPIMS